VKKRADYHQVAHDYTFQIPSDHNASIHMGKPPYFDGTGYNQWKTKMFGYLSAIHKDLWKIIEVGCEILEDGEATTPVQAYVLQRNYQALNILHSSVSPEEFDKIEDSHTTKDAWDTLQVNHQGSRKVRESRIKTLEDEQSLFSMKKDETVKEMYNRMKKIINQIKSLGGDKWGDREIVDKLLTVYIARDVTLPSLIRAERGFKHFTAENVLGRIEAHHDQLKWVKINQDLADLQEQAAKNNGLALQAKLKGKEKSTQSSNNDDSSDGEDDELDDEQMAFFIKNFRRVPRKSNFQNFGKNKHESRRRSSKPYFGCKKIGHFIADCPEEKKKNKDTKENSFKRDKPRYKKHVGEAHLGQEWDSNEESNSNNEDVATMAFKTLSSNQPSLFEDLTDDEDQDSIICLMAKNSKVISQNSSDDEIDEEDEIASLIKQCGKSAATRIMKLIMKLDDLNETLESQEELFRLEREKSETLEKHLSNERKKNKRLEESLKAKDSILLEIEESFTSEKKKVNDLTKELFLVEDTHANLKKDNEKLQESLTSLQAINTALEVKVNTLLESSPNTCKLSKSSSPSTSNGCARCFNVDIQTCATNHAEMQAMKKEISRLTQLVQEEAPSHKQVLKTNLSPWVGEFEKRAKGFGLKYLSKYGFEKGKGLGKNEDGESQTISYVKNNKKAALGAKGGLVNMTTPIHKRIGEKQGISHIKFIKRGTTCDEDTKIVASSLKQDKFQAPKTQKSLSQISSYADYVLNRNHLGKVVAIFVGHRSWNTKVKSHVWVPKVLLTNTQG
jgi:hypothetical protein